MENRSRIQQKEEDVEEVKVIMLNNVDKINDRYDNLNDLEDRSEKLLEAGKRFEKTTSKLEQQHRPKNKTKTILIVVVVVVVLIIITGATVGWYFGTAK